MNIEILAIRGIKQDIIEEKEKINKEFRELENIYTEVLNKLSTDDLKEIATLKCVNEIGGIYLDAPVLREWDSQKDINYINTFRKKMILNHRDKNLVNLYKFLEEIKSFYKE